MAVRGAALVGCVAVCSAGMVAALAKVPFQSVFESGRLFFVGADDEDVVVSGDRTYYFWPVFVVDAGSDGLGASSGRDEDEEVHRLADFEAEALEKFVDSGQGIGVGFSIRWQGIAGRAFVQAKLVDVARKSRLSDVKAAPCKFLSQFILTGDGGLDQQFLNDGMALLFHWVCLYLLSCRFVFKGD
jgi:hypothetical protein